MYYITGADQKRYGPVPADQVCRWLAEGRANAQTLVCAEGEMDWKPLSAFPEFADALAASSPPPAFAAADTAPHGVPDDLLNRDYELDIGACLSRGWDLLQKNFGLVFGGVGLWTLVQLFIGGLGMIPLVNILTSVVSLVIMGPLTGGMYFFLLKAIRRQPVQVGDVFCGFRLAFAQLLLGYLVPALLSGLTALPGLAILAYPVFSMFQHQAVDPSQVIWVLVGFIVAMVPLTYFSVSWLFSLPLIIDRQVEFWPAMRASRRMVGKHWWLVFGLLVVCALLNLLGIMVCCVGVFITLPIGFGAMMYAYESIFSAPAPRAP